MNQDVFDREIRKFLKKVGITSHQKIEQAVQNAIARGQLQGNEMLTVSVVVKLPGINFSETISGEIALE